MKRKFTHYSLPITLLIAGCGDDDALVPVDSVDAGQTASASHSATARPSASSSMTTPVTTASASGDAAVDLDASMPDADMSDAGADAGDGAADGATDGATDGGISLQFPASALIENASLPAGFVAWRWAGGIADPRGITLDEAGNVLVVSRDTGSVVALWDDDGDGVSGAGERVEVAEGPDLAHGIALNGGYLYASNASTVYRYEYTSAREALGAGSAVITGIPEGGNHTSRTLLFDATYLYVTVGSASNVDDDSSRARIHRFLISELDDSAAIDFEDGELFADGLRNEVGITLDSEGRVWGVENGRDDLQRSDLGTDIYLDNPGEELNLFAEPGKFYGYPYCWSEGALGDAGMGPNTQWADPDNTTHSDDWCQDPANVVPPVFSLQAHSAPLDLLFYSGNNFPASYVGDALITLHGSWNRPEEDAVGYKVVRLRFGANGLPSGTVESLFEYQGDGDRPLGDAAIEATWPIRPVGIATLPNGVILVTSDASNEIIAIGYQP
jgi:glucose/arabinose dehydrogenase